MREREYRRSPQSVLARFSALIGAAGNLGIVVASGFGFGTGGGVGFFSHTRLASGGLDGGLFAAAIEFGLLVYHDLYLRNNVFLMRFT